MKIGIVTEYFHPTVGGITENVYNFAKQLLIKGHDFRIITPKAGNHDYLDKRVKERIIHVGKRIPVFFNGSNGAISLGFGLGKKISEILKHEQFDIVNTHSPSYPTLPIFAVMNKQSPTVGTFHTCAKFHWHHRLYYHALRPVIARLDGCIAVSEVCKIENEQCYGGSKYTVIPNGVDVGFWQKPVKRPEVMDDKYKWIVFLGRPDERNGLNVLIDAFRLVRRNISNVKMLVVGDGPLLFYYKKLAREFGNNIIFAGHADEDRSAYLQFADVMCFLPEIASFGITVLEGMSAKCPMVLSDIPAFRSLVENNKDALLVPPKSFFAIADAIEKLLSDKEFSDKLKINAYQKVQKYDWSNVADQTIDYYKQIVRG